MIRWTRLVGIALLVAAGCGGKDSHGDEHGEEGEDHEEDVVELTPEGIQRSGIRMAPARREALIGGQEVPAEVQLNPDRVAHVTPLVTGQVASVSAALGDLVKKGQVLASLKSVALADARAEVARAAAAVRLARTQYDRQLQLDNEGIGAKRELIEAKNALDRSQSELAAANSRVRVYGGAGAGGANVQITSPLDGVITERHATPGEVVDGKEPMFVVADVSRVWVIGRVYEQDVAAAQVGTQAVVTLQAYPGRSWPGTVGYVGAVLDEHTRTLPIRIELDNPDGTLRPGLFGSIALPPPESGGAQLTVVPEEAVLEVEGRDVVFVPAGEPNHFRAVPVKTGAHAHRLVEIREGVKPGDQVVVAGAFVLKSELLKGQMAEGHAH